MFHGDFHAVDGAQDAPAHFVERTGELFDFLQCLAEELVETSAECGVVRSHRCQHARMIKRRIQPLLQFAHARDHAGIHERVEIAEACNFFAHRIEAPQQLHVLLGQRRHVSIRQDFNQRNFERRKRECAIEAVSALLPLSGHARMPVEKCCDHIGLVAVNVAGFPAAHKVTQQSFRDLRIRIWSERPAEHGRRDGHVQQV